MDFWVDAQFKLKKSLHSATALPQRHARSTPASCDARMSTQTRDLIGWLGFAVALAAYRAPFREVWGSYGIINVRSTAHLATGLPFIAGLVNNSLWLSYYAA